MLSDKELKYLETMSPEEKYRLYNECEFLISNDYAKLNYISEKGFGKALVRFITGGGKKAERTILENNAKLLEIMKDILVCLDDEIQHNKQRLKEHSDILIALHLTSLRFANLMKAVCERLEYIDEFLSKEYPDYKKWDAEDIQAELESLRRDINVKIDELNRQEKQRFIRFKDEEKRIDNAKSTRILRPTPTEAIIITKKGIEERVSIDGGKEYR